MKKMYSLHLGNVVNFISITKAPNICTKEFQARVSELIYAALEIDFLIHTDRVEDEVGSIWL